MKALIATFLIGSALVFAPAALACEKHLDGHQQGSSTNTEMQRNGEAARR
jgi:hypothetical protein